jgi:hypothetical protein
VRDLGLPVLSCSALVCQATVADMLRSWDDEMLAMLRPQYADWDLWTVRYVYPGPHSTWCAKPKGAPVATINADSPEQLIAEIREQENRAQASRQMRDHDVSTLTARELERARRDLAASLALARPDSPTRVPIMARMAAVDAKLAELAGACPPHDWVEIFRSETAVTEKCSKCSITHTYKP